MLEVFLFTSETAVFWWGDWSAFYIQMRVPIDKWALAVVLATYRFEKRIMKVDTVCIPFCKAVVLMTTGKKKQLNCQLVIILKYFAHVFVDVPHQRAVSCDWAVAHFIVHSACSCVLWVFPHNRDLELVLKKVRIVSNPKRTVLIYWWLLKWSVGRSVIRPVIRPAKWRQIHACLLCTIYLSPALFFRTL